MKNFKKKIILEKKLLTDCLDNLCSSKLDYFEDLCNDSVKAIKNKKKIILFGNGGSAADAQHLATELTVKYKKKRKPLPAISLATDNSAITAIGNDFSFKQIFSRQIEALGNKGDIVLGITTSGNSENILEAFKSANKLSIKNYCFVGNNGGSVIKYCKKPIIFPKTTTSITQVMQIFLGQIYCEFLEESFF